MAKLEVAPTKSKYLELKRDLATATQGFELLDQKKNQADHQPLIDAFAAALALYREGKFDEAMAAFQKVLTIRPDDGVSAMYVERCKNLKEQPPAPPWDGVFVMTKK